MKKRKVLIDFYKWLFRENPFLSEEKIEREVDVYLSINSTINKQENKKCHCKNSQFTRTVTSDFEPMCGRCGLPI
jgi:hypothetical protein